SASPSNISAGGRDLAAAGPVEDPPHQEVVAKIFKPMVGPGGHEKEVAGLEGVPLAIVKQDATAANDDVDLVLCVRRLLIRARRRPEDDVEGAAAQNTDGALAGRDPRLGLGKADHTATTGRGHDLLLVSPPTQRSTPPSRFLRLVGDEE